MRFFLIFATFFSMTSAHADLLKTCDMNSTQEVLSQNVLESLKGLFLIQEQNLDESKVSIVRAEDLVIDSYPKDYVFSTFQVTFVSPKGTNMSLRSDDPYDSIFAFPTLAFNFEIRVERDAEGFLTKKTCEIRYYKNVVVINEVNGAKAPMTELLWREIPTKKQSPLSLLTLELPMELVE